MKYLSPENQESWNLSSGWILFKKVSVYFTGAQNEEGV